jgi:hypothetical protein
MGRNQVLIMSAINWPVVRPHVDKISAAFDQARSGTVKTIDCGVFLEGLRNAGG